MADHRFLYENDDIKPRDISVYIYLEERTNSEGICWPSIPTIAKDLKCSRSTVERAISDLKKLKLITTDQRYRSNGSFSSLEFTLPRTATKNNWRKKHET